MRYVNDNKTGWSAASAAYDSVLKSLEQRPMPEGVDRRAVITILKQQKTAILEAAGFQKTEAEQSEESDEIKQSAEGVKARFDANMLAMKLVASGQVLTPSERTDVRQFSGWGGLREKVWESDGQGDWIVKPAIQAAWPDGFALPDATQLIWEYYTPKRVCNAISELLHGQVNEWIGQAGAVRAIEPSAGVGRFLEAFNNPSISWTAVEPDAISGKLLKAAFPDAFVEQAFFEQFAAEQPAGNFDLWLSNPPYSQRGPSAQNDPVFRKEKNNYHYFLKRAGSYVRPGGIAVYMIPTGFMTATGKQYESLRTWMLKRWHLLTAYRLPDDVWDGGAKIVTDVVLLERRDGMLLHVAPGDEDVIAGRYFLNNPDHILGTESYDESRGRNAYRVVGEFRGFGEYRPRPICIGCTTTSEDSELPAVGAKAGKKLARGIAATAVDISAAPMEVKVAAALGTRSARYFAMLAAQQMDIAHVEQPQLLDALRAFVEAYGPPSKVKALKNYQSTVASITSFLASYKNDEVVVGITTRPVVAEAPVRTGSSLAVFAALSRSLVKGKRGPTIEQIIARAREGGTVLSPEDVLGDLVANRYCYRADGGWEPPNTYYATEGFWVRYDEADAESQNEDLAEWMRTRFRYQLQELRSAGGVLDVADIAEVDPRQNWVPVSIIQKWFNGELLKLKGQFPYAQHYADEKRVITPQKLVRDGAGMLTYQSSDRGLAFPARSEQLKEFFKRPEGIDADSWPGVVVLRYFGMFRQRTEFLKFPDVAYQYRKFDERVREIQIEKARNVWIEEKLLSFKLFLADLDDGDREAIANAYNRTYRGVVKADFRFTTPLARWDSKAVTPAMYQWAAANRLLHQRGGVLCLDVGLGKTFTSILGICLGKQTGQIKRPAVIAPAQVAVKWKKEFLKAIPDFVVEFIGLEETVKKDGTRTTRKDTAVERERKIRDFRLGLTDVIIFTFESFDASQIDPADVETFLKDNILLDLMAHQTGSKLPKDERQEDEDTNPGSLSQIAKEKAQLRVEAFMADRLSKPDGQGYDVGTSWSEFGIDCLVVDEAQNFKNLYTPNGGRYQGIPKFMGGSQPGAKQSYQMSVRTHVVRNSGGQVWLLSATPAKNSPLEFFSIISYTLPDVLARFALTTPESFIQRFLVTKERLMAGMTSDGELVNKKYISGFKNLDDFRNLLEMTCEFKFPEDVRDESALKIPTGIAKPIYVLADEDQDLVLEHLRGEIQDAMGTRDGATKLLGLLAQMSMAAVHPVLYKMPATDMFADENEKSSGGLGYRQAMAEVAAGRINPWTSRYRAICERVLAARGCAHIIFGEAKASHAFIRACLIESGIEEGRIAIMNGETVKDAGAKTRIAEKFNGRFGEMRADGTYEPPEYDIVIANSIAYEGIDLQIRTCEIHHADLPWEPATLQQRNGRGVRQGNQLSVVQINYYILKRSPDGIRFNLIQGKRGWLTSVLSSTDRETNNPASADIDPTYQALSCLARDDQELEQIVAKARASLELAESASMIATNIRTLAAACEQLSVARAAKDQDAASRLFSEVDKKVTYLRSQPERLFPFAHVLDIMRNRPVWLTDAGNVFYEGLAFARGNQLKFFLSAERLHVDPRNVQRAITISSNDDLVYVNSSSKLADEMKDWDRADGAEFPYQKVANRLGGAEGDVSPGRTIPLLVLRLLPDDKVTRIFDEWLNRKTVTVFSDLWTIGERIDLAKPAINLQKEDQGTPYPVFDDAGNSKVAWAKLPIVAVGTVTAAMISDKIREGQLGLTNIHFETSSADKEIEQEDGTVMRLFIDRSRLVAPTYANFYRWVAGLKDSKIPFKTLEMACRYWFARPLPMSARTAGAESLAKPVEPEPRKANADPAMVAKIRQMYRGDPRGAIAYAARFMARPWDVL